MNARLRPLPARPESIGEKLAEHTAWIEGHEKRCEERYGAIQAQVGEIRADIKLVLRLGFGLLLGVCGWLAVQLYDGAQADVAADAARIAALEHPAPPAAVVQMQAPAARR